MEWAKVMPKKGTAFRVNENCCLPPKNESVILSAMVAQKPSLRPLLRLNIQHSPPPSLLLCQSRLQLLLQIEKSSHSGQVHRQRGQIRHWLSHIPSVLAVGDREEERPICCHDCHHPHSEDMRGAAGVIITCEPRKLNQPHMRLLDTHLQLLSVLDDLFILWVEHRRSQCLSNSPRGEPFVIELNYAVRYAFGKLDKRRGTLRLLVWLNYSHQMPQQSWTRFSTASQTKRSPFRRRGTNNSSDIYSVAFSAYGRAGQPIKVCQKAEASSNLLLLTGKSLRICSSNSPTFASFLKKKTILQAGVLVILNLLQGTCEQRWASFKVRIICESNDAIILLMKGGRQAEKVMREETEGYLKARWPHMKGLEGLDLKGLCVSVGEELREVEIRASEDYLAVGGELKELGTELTVADEVMEGLQHVLSDFKENLEATRAEMGQLQQRTKRMASALTNKKQVQELLTSFIESAVLEGQLKQAIFSAPIDEKYCSHIRQLLKKINYLNSNLITPDSKAVKELQPQLEKLKGKAAVRLRQFLLDQISLLKRPKTSVQTLQRTVLGKYRAFSEFFRQQNTPIYAQLCNAYRETMAKLYLNNYRLYLSEVEKLQVQLYHRSDTIIPSESQNLRSQLSQGKHVPLAAGNRSIFCLAGRDAVLENEYLMQGIKLQARQAGQRFTCQRLFRAVNTCLINQVIHEMIFTAEFFHLKSEGASHIFGPLFRPTSQLFLEFVRSKAGHSNDIFAVLIVLALSERNRQRLDELGCSVLDSYFSQVGMMLWPRFQQLFEGHLNSLLTCSPSHFKKLDKGTQILTQRFADFLTSLYRLYSYFPSSSVMFQKRLQAIRKAFFQLTTKVIGEAEESQSQYLNVLEEIHSSCVGDPVVCNFKQFHEYQQELEREIQYISDRVTRQYLKIVFPALNGLVERYCKQGNQELLSLQGEIQERVVEGVVRQVSGAALEKGLNRLWEHFSQRHKGYSLRLLGKKTTNSFTRSYGQLYKYCKNNYPSLATSLMPTHTVIKQLKSTFTRT